MAGLGCLRLYSRVSNQPPIIYGRSCRIWFCGHRNLDRFLLHRYFPAVRFFCFTSSENSNFPPKLIFVVSAKARVPSFFGPKSLRGGKNPNWKYLWNSLPGFLIESQQQQQRKVGLGPGWGGHKALSQVTLTFPELKQKKFFLIWLIWQKSKLKVINGLLRSLSYRLKIFRVGREVRPDF